MAPVERMLSAVEALTPLAVAVAPHVKRLFKKVGGAAVKRIWGALKGTKTFHSISKWPIWAQHAQLRSAAEGSGPHDKLLGNRDRHGLFHFLAANGLNPRQAGEHVLAGDVRGFAEKAGHAGVDFIQHNGYQQAAEKHVQTMVQDATSGAMWNTAKRFMSMNLGRVVKSKEHADYIERMFLQQSRK